MVSGAEQQNHLFLFVMALSTADLLLLLTIPMSVTDIVLERWVFGGTLPLPSSLPSHPRGHEWRKGVFGEVMCTGFWLVEGMNKISSVSILTLMSFDRWLALRFPRKAFKLRSPKGACVQISLAGLLSLLLIVPMLVFTRTFPRPFPTPSFDRIHPRLPDVMTFRYFDRERNRTIAVEKCLNDIPHNRFANYFFSYM